MSKFWMQKAFETHPGALHRKLGVPSGEKIPASKLASARKSAEASGDTKTLRQLNLAKTASKIARKESVSSYIVRSFTEDYPGESDDGGHDIPEAELEKGMKVEREHKDVWDLIKDRVGDILTDDQFYGMIAKAHLREKPTYYSLLAKYVES